MPSTPVLLKLPVFQDPRGNLTFLQNNDQIPFEINRVYWTFDVPAGDERGGHAYKAQHECIIALSGSFDVVVRFPDKKEIKYTLNRAHMGLYLPPLTWRSINNFSTNALSLHLSSHQYIKDDYIRDYDQFVKSLNEANSKL